MILIVAEKPSVARDIARVMKCGAHGEGCLRGEKYIVAWAVGHLVTLCEPDELDEKYKKWRMADLPIIPEKMETKVIRQTKDQFEILKKLMLSTEVESLICATDAGREGELIFRLIYEKAGCTKAVERLWISSMTDEAIREGFASLKSSSFYDGLYLSAQCRSQADWLVGMNASRAFTLRYNTLLSIGRVQTPTLNILVKRYHEIADFKPVEYYTVTADFGDFTALWFDETNKDERVNTRLTNGEKANEIVKIVKGKAARVRKVTGEEKRDIAPQLYDLTSLQRDANKSLGFTADKTLKTAQALYEKWKMLTYPRTDSRYLPMDMAARAKQTLQRLPANYSEFVQHIPYAANGGLPVTKRIFDNEKISDHHALIPTPQTHDYDKLPPDEKRLFDMVAKRTIAAFYPPFVYEQAKAVLCCEDQLFKATGRTVRAQGWKAVYQGESETEQKPKKKAKQEEADKALPPLHEGDLRDILKASAKKDQTKAPAPHTDASLLAAMENAGRELEEEALRESMKGSGLGTPATRAAIIERLITVGYAARKGRALSATEKGVRLIDIAPEQISSPEMTGKWELALNEIAESKRDANRFMQGIRSMTSFLIDYAKKTEKQGSFPEDERRKAGGKAVAATGKILPDVVCPLCGQAVQETEKAFGCTAWRSGCKFTLWKDALSRGGGPMLNDKIIILLLKNGTVRGSTGLLALADGLLSFTPSTENARRIVVPIRYERQSSF